MRWVSADVIVTFCGAGVPADHPPALLYLSAACRCVHLDAGGAALGLLPGAEYEEVVEAFGPNDVLLLYTDGVLEARWGDEEFGSERLEAAFTRVAGRGAQEIAEAVVEAAREFAGGVLADDVTLLVLKNTRPGTSRPRQLQNGDVGGCECQD